MKLTDKIRKQANELAEKHGFDELFVNEKGEFFSNKSHAANSVGHDKEKYAKVPIAGATKAEKGTTSLETGKELIAEIEKAEDAESVMAILVAEEEGKNRKTVVEAANKKLEALASKKDSE